MLQQRRLGATRLTTVDQTAGTTTSQSQITLFSLVQIMEDESETGQALVNVGVNAVKMDSKCNAQPPGGWLQ